jgi:hypothetical protein
MAEVGDRVVLETERVDRPHRTGVVEEILDLDRPRYSIQWDDGHRSIVSPASGALQVAQPVRSPTGFASMLFRAVNERIRELAWAWFDEQDFVCECADPECFQPMRMGSKEFDALRSDPRVFAVVPGHEHPATDAVLLRTDRYVLVRQPTREAWEGG